VAVDSCHLGAVLLGAGAFGRRLRGGQNALGLALARAQLDWRM
jgi:hypothetical protein